MTPERVLEHLSLRLPRFEADGVPELCASNARRIVWRVPGRPAAIVVKAPGTSEVGEEADPAGLLFEARSLEVLGPTGALADVSTPEVRPPRLIDFDDARHVLVEEDAGPHPHLGRWLAEGRPAEQIGHRLGRFVGALHAASRGRRELAGFFERPALAPYERALSSAALADLYRRAGVEPAEDVLERVEAVGQRAGQGAVLVVGDLRPEAVRVTPAGLRLVDWGRAHFGSPAEDVGRLTAHLWMRIHRAGSVHAAVQASIVLRDFLESYAATVVAAPGVAYDAQDVEACALHFGTALLAGAVGAEACDSLYDNLPPGSPIVQEAAAIALRHLRAPEDVDMFSVLRAD